MLRTMDPSSGEYPKCKVWIDGFMKLPFGVYRSVSISLADGLDACDAFMTNAKRVLDDAVFGLDDAKLQILQWLGQIITNPESVGTSIAIYGPPGTGKTSLIKEGVSKILNRPFAFIPLGGATDSTFLEGHAYTYEGSVYGKIAQILIESECMNPVIFFDELDKVSETPKGDEINGVLTHLTDTTQNTEFNDKFFSEIKLDVSKCLFFFSYNNEEKLNPILKDRLYRITTKGFDTKQKTTIALQYLIPRIAQQVKLDLNDVVFTPEIIQYIVSNYAPKEEGVRNLKRCLEIIFTKLNLCRLLKPENKIMDTTSAVSFPVSITPAIVDKFLKRDEASGVHLQMYI
jgi:ATP-dependent Lon protease